MDIERFRDYDGLSNRGAEIVLSEIKKKKDLLLCTARGSSPLGLYEQLTLRSEKDVNLFKDLKIIGLDEWGGISKNHPITCEYFLKTKLINPLNITEQRTILFKSDPVDPLAECSRIQSELDRRGPIDLCILGLGKNGHLGFNEPGAFIEPYCHKADLSDESMQHSMIDSTEVLPGYGLTLGMKDILSSGKIMLLISGKEKKSATEKFLEGRITPQLPATFLWLHDNVNCLIDEDVF